MDVGATTREVEEMILTGNRARLISWCFDKYGDPRAIQWLKDRLFDISMHYYERNNPQQW